MIVIQLSLRLLVKSVCLLLLKPTLFQGSEAPLGAGADAHRLVVNIDPNGIRMGRREDAGRDPAASFRSWNFKAKLLRLTICFYRLLGDRISIDDKFYINVRLTSL